MNAYGNGSICLNCPVENIPEEVIKIGNEVFTEIADSPDGGLWLTLEYGRHEDPDDFLDAMIPYTKSGYVEYTSEYEDHWRYEFRDGKWEELTGRITYDDKPDMGITVGHIIDNPNFDINCDFIIQDARDQETILYKTVNLERKTPVPTELLTAKVTYITTREWAIVIEARV